MREWSRDGREPSHEERSRIDLGLIAVRELEGADGEEAQLAEKLSCLNNYFEDWPSDETAASASDDDFFEKE